MKVPFDYLCTQILLQTELLKDLSIMLFWTYNYLGMKQQANSQQYIDEYRLIKQLGSGYQAVVYLAIDRKGNRVAIKKFKKLPSVTNSIEEELEAMQQLHHENLIRLISIRQNAIYKDKMQLVSNCFAIILQYAAGGQLFDFIADTGKFSEKVTRTYFHQIMNGIHYMHEKGYAHRDIKPENLLLSETFILKVADFGFCCLLKGRDGKGILKTRLGTQGYMAPQIFCKQYDGRKTDIFAAGVILFIMYTGTPPFEKAIVSDPYYKLLKEKKMAAFWQSHAKKKPYGYFSDDFKDLFQKMTANDPEERLTISEIAKHPWVKSGICTHSEIKKQFSERKERLMRVLDERRKQYKLQQRYLNDQISSQGSSYRGEKSSSSFLETYFKQKLLKHNWPEMQAGDSMHFLVRNHDTEFVMCMLKQHLQCQQFDLQFKTAQEEDLIESECEDFLMKAEQVIIQDKTLKATYLYSTYLKKIEISHRIVIRICFGKDKKGNSIIHIEPEDDIFYCRLIQRNIEEYFS